MPNSRVPLPHPPDLMHEAVALTSQLRRANARIALALGLLALAVFGATFAVAFADRWLS
jgi:hypothetical protein